MADCAVISLQFHGQSALPHDFRCHQLPGKAAPSILGTPGWGQTLSGTGQHATHRSPLFLLPRHRFHTVHKTTLLQRRGLFNSAQASEKSQEPSGGTESERGSENGLEGEGSFGAIKQRGNEVNLKEWSRCSKVATAVLVSGIIACVKRENQAEALIAARAALDGGITVLEVTMTVPGALKVVASLVGEYPDAVIGVGTIYTAEEAEAAAEAGAHFVMSPIFNEDIVSLQKELDVLYIPGAMTPTEIWRAHQAGCQLVKMFPASEATLRALRRPLSRLPGLSLVASHGIQEEDIGRFLGDRLAGAVVLSDPIFGHDWDAADITEAAERVIALAQNRRLCEAKIVTLVDADKGTSMRVKLRNQAALSEFLSRLGIGFIADPEDEDPIFTDDFDDVQDGKTYMYGETADQTFAAKVGGKVARVKGEEDEALDR